MRHEDSTLTYSRRRSSNSHICEFEECTKYLQSLAVPVHWLQVVWFLSIPIWPNHICVTGPAIVGIVRSRKRICLLGFGGYQKFRV